MDSDILSSVDDSSIKNDENNLSSSFSSDISILSAMNSSTEEQSSTFYVTETQLSLMMML